MTTPVTIPLKELIKSPATKIDNTNNVIVLFPIINTFAILVKEFNKVDIKMIRICNDMENIILPNDYVIQCMGNRYHIMKIKISNDMAVTTITMTTDDAEYLAGVIKWYQTFDMMDEQFNV